MILNLIITIYLSVYYNLFYVLSNPIYEVIHIRKTLTSIKVDFNFFSFCQYIDLIFYIQNFTL